MAKQKRGRETKQEIFVAALKLFSQKGYDAVSMRELANVVGIRESSVYNHFAGKEQILEAVFEFFIDNIREGRPQQQEVQELLDYLSPAELLKQLILGVGKRIDESLDQAARIIYSEKYRNPRARQIFQHAVLKEPTQYLAEVFAIMVQKKLIAPVDVIFYAEQYNYVVVALTEEFSLAKSNGESVAPIVKKMLKNAEFYATLLQSPVGK